MLFLIEYDRQRGRLASLRQFEDSEARVARETRLELELDLHRVGVDREVVLLETRSEDDLRRTHRRYFVGIAELTAASKSTEDDR